MFRGRAEGVHSPEFQKKIQRKRLFKIILISLFAIILISLPVYLLRTEKFLIHSVLIQGNNVTKNEELQAVINRDLEGNYLWIFPHSNALLYPKKKIASDLLIASPRLLSAQLSLNNARSLSVIVEERSPYALYCTDVLNINLPSGCYFMDTSGYIFSEAPSFSEGVYFVYASLPTLDPVLRQQYIDSKKFNSLSIFIKSLSNVGLYPKIFVQKNDEYNLILSNGAVIMWKKDQDLDKIKSNLESFVTDQNFAKDKSNLSKLLYIDLRFGNKVFYKFRDSA